MRPANAKHNFSNKTMLSCTPNANSRNQQMYSNLVEAKKTVSRLRETMIFSAARHRSESHNSKTALSSTRNHHIFWKVLNYPRETATYGLTLAGTRRLIRTDTRNTLEPGRSPYQLEKKKKDLRDLPNQMQAKR